MNSGYIKLFRSLLKWEWYDDVNTCRLFIHLLLTANYRDTKWHGVDIPAGSRACSIRSLAKETGLTERMVRTSLNRLKSTHEVTQTIKPKFSIISIKNYAEYQSGDTVCDTQATQTRHSNDTQATQSKESKEIKESKNIPPIIPPRGEQGERLTVEKPRGTDGKSADHSTTPVSKNEERFNRFWEVYPKKVGKGAARKSWDKCRPSEELTARMIAAVRQQAQSDQWRRDGGQYIPNPATWLNQERWEDEVRESTAPAMGFGRSYDLSRFEEKTLKPPVYHRKDRKGTDGDQRK